MPTNARGCRGTPCPSSLPKMDDPLYSAQLLNDGTTRMGRRRTRDFDLPPRLYRKGGRYYYGRQMLALGSDLAKAKRLWAEYEYTTPYYTVSMLLQKWKDGWPAEWAKNTLKAYRLGIRVANDQWGDLPAHELTAPMIATFRDTKGTSKSNFNMARTVLLSAYSKGIEWGIVEHNPCDHVARNKLPVRERYLEDAEYDAVYKAAPDWMKLAMDIAYSTALRPIDVIGIRWSDVSATHLTVLPRKTKRGRIAQQYPLTGTLGAAVQAARARSVLGLFVVADARGRRISTGRYQDVWRRLVDGLGIADAEFRDIRSKAATDRESQEGITEAQELLGHRSTAMTERYMKKVRVRQVEPMSRSRLVAKK